MAFINKWQKFLTESREEKKLAKLNESFAPLMQSNDLDAINQAIDLAISMEEIPEPDRYIFSRGQSTPATGRIHIYYKGKNSPAGDIFEEWLKQYITPRSERVHTGEDDVETEWAASYDVGEDMWYYRFEADNRGGSSVFTIQLPDSAIANFLRGQQKRGNPLIKEGISGSGLHDLVAGRQLYDIELKKLKNAAYISGQRNEKIEKLLDDLFDPHFAYFDDLRGMWEEGRQWAKEKTESYGIKEGMWPMEDFLQSDDLANVNQGIDLAVMMGDIPDPDKIKMHRFNKLAITYNSKEDGDRFIEWLKQNGVPHEEGDVVAGKPFYGAYRRQKYFRSTPEKMNQPMPGFTRIRISIAAGDEGFDDGPISGAAAIGIRGVK